MMLKKLLNGFIVVFLMLSYINRGLFVDMSEANDACSTYTAHTKNEINSVLEFIFEMTGNPNDIDEDGNTPENYSLVHFSQLLICQDCYQTLETHHLLPKEIKKTYPVFSDEIISSPVLGQIDHPPQS